MRITKLKGARTHNLRGVDLEVEPGSYVAIVGPSGAGKSSLAFGTFYAEGQRRYVESFSAYARQFLERLARPPVTLLDPVPVGIAVDRQAPVRTSRSTVGTMTEIADYTKSLWAHAAVLHCPSCERPVRPDAPNAAAATICEQAPDQRVMVTYPLPCIDAEHFIGVREALVGDGYRRVRVGTQVRDLDEIRPSDVVNGAGGVLDVVADRTTSRDQDKARLVEALEAAMRRGDGRATVWLGDNAYRFSSTLHCSFCDTSFRPATPATFSFNNPIGACETCRGFGRTIEIDLERVLPDHSLTLDGGAIKAWQGKAAAWERRELVKKAKLAGIPLDKPLNQFSEAEMRWLIDGDDVGYPKGWWGIRSWFKWMESRAYKMHVRVFLSRYRRYERCQACHGTRLKPIALAWKIDGMHLPQFYAEPAADALRFLRSHEQAFAADPRVALLWREATSRLQALVDVGLGYLSLDRQSRTLSGGEAQRVALTGALGATLSGAMFVLDEPTVGLHPRDVDRLLGVVQALARDDNVALVVEHDEDMILGADRVIELGPGAGEHGGEVVFDGTPTALQQAHTATGAALTKRSTVKRKPRKPRGWLKLHGASGHNLRNVDLKVPLGVLSCVTGVSGSGKSSLFAETLLPALAQAFGQAVEQAPLPFEKLTGTGTLKRVVGVDQAPLGRTSRGNPATYLKIWDLVRKRFVAHPLARERGYKPGMFSFNVPGGRCEACRGEGAETVEMQFLADVSFSCPECQGRRFSGPVLEIEHLGKNVAEVLEFTVNEAIELFAKDRPLLKALRPLRDVGLGYLRLGQPLNTLSGGEAQRLKLVAALGDANEDTVLILDEPTAGLHASDVEQLWGVLDGLVEAGTTVIAIEHDMRFAALADHVIDVGPGAGPEGGCIVVAGTPKQVASHVDSHTAPPLRRVLAGDRVDASSPTRPRAKDAPNDAIQISGAREHNLRGVDVELPRGRLVVVSGPSGSGKSTLAFDVLFAEAQRRYLETLSPYARQYMPQLSRPNVDRVTGVPPSVSLEQRLTRGGANSTVATVTEVAHYLRLLWARAGVPHCVTCQVPIEPRSKTQLAQDLKKRFKKRRFTLLAPIVRGRKGIHRELLKKVRERGFTEARIDGEIVRLTPGMKLDRYAEHDVSIVVDRLTANDAAQLDAALEVALRWGEGAAEAVAGPTTLLLSTRQACPSCGEGYPELDPRFFSFNTRQGQCEVCEGRGEVIKKAWRGRRRKREVSATPCEACAQTRLSPLARAVTVGTLPIVEVMGKSVSDALRTLAALNLDGRAGEIGRVPIAEATRRLLFLEQVGLGYLELDRRADTLSGGELQRVRLAAQLGSGLTGVLYVLDEPTIGLHPRDTQQLLDALRSLVDKGNSVVVVEHDADTIRAADHVVDVGPGGGHHGGTIVAAGAPATLKHAPTLRALAEAPPIPPQRRSTRDVNWIGVKGATHHNLQGVDVDFPAGCMTVVTGVSGSGKSSLVREVLLRGVREELDLVNDVPPGACAGFEGVAAVRRAVEIDQSPIGRTPRSVPATYTGVWNHIRKLLAGTPGARARGYGPARFSFNTKEGRCPACEGQGSVRVEMAFLPDVHVPCEVCKGLRFTPETLLVDWHGHNVGELLQLEVSDAIEVFSAIREIRRPLTLLQDLGLGYLQLGQASNTLSGGEAQRLKLVAELGVGGQAGPTLYVMDEPTTGLHRADVRRLLGVLNRLVDRGDTLVVIEHQPDMMLAADWIIDLGPEGGAGGGRVVAQGSPEALAKRKRSHTGRLLARELAATTARAKTQAPVAQLRA